MKKIALVFLLTLSFSYGADYSSMSLEELQSARGSVAEGDRDAFKSEMQSRMQSLSPQEREDAKSSMRQSGSGSQDGSSQMRRDGSGSMNRQRRGR